MRNVQNVAHAPKFSAFIIKDTGKALSSGKPCYNYELTASTDRYPLDAIVWKGGIVGRDQTMADFAGIVNKNGANAMTNRFFREPFLEMMRDYLVKVVRLSAWSWSIPEDLGKREKLMQCSNLAIRREPDGNYTLTIEKSASPS